MFAQKLNEETLYMIKEIMICINRSHLYLRKPAKIFINIREI